MVTKTCPHLGRRDDPSTIFNYPTAGNFCHHVRPLSPPSEDHQFQYCLSAQHRECPVYQAVAGKHLPVSAQMVGWSDSVSFPANFIQRFSLWQLGLLLFLGVSVLIGAVFWVVAVNPGFLAAPLETTRIPILSQTSTLIPTRPPSTPTIIPLVSGESSPMWTATSALFELTVTSSETATFTNTPVTPFPPLPSPTVTQVCTLPPGWVIYTVQSGDTLFTISKATGSTVAQLQQSNCLGNSTKIITGQKLFVPKLPEVATPTPTLVPSSTVSPTQSPAPSPTSTPFTPTSVPPTLTNTSIPSTNTPIPSPIPSATSTESANPTQPPFTQTPTTQTPAPGP